MTALDTVYACPWCHLRFLLLPELRAHVDDEHPSPDADPPAPATRPLGTFTVPMDPDRPAPVALAIAAQTGAGLDLVAAPGVGLHDGAEAFLRARALDLRATEGSRATWRVLPADRPAQAVLDHLGATGADLACMSTRASTGPSHVLFGSVAESVLLGSEVPVLLAGPHVAAPPAPYRRVIACVDGSPHATNALALARRLRSLLGAELHLVEVIDPRSEPTPDTYEGAELVRIAQEIDPPPTSYELLHGAHPGATIADHADRLDDVLVVLGTHRRTGLRSVLAGSVARGVVGTCRHPVVVVPLGADATAFLQSPPTTTDTASEGAP
jgi:nucleotide-binding universal stress UspA family protein